MMDIVERLRTFSSKCEGAVDANGYGNLAASPNAVAGWKEAEELTRVAAEEIERLRSLCGAARLSDGFRTLTKDAKREVNG